MLDELDGYAEQTEGFALALEMICEAFGLTCQTLEDEEEGSLNVGKRSETEQGEAGGSEARGRLHA